MACWSEPLQLWNEEGSAKKCKIHWRRRCLGRTFLFSFSILHYNHQTIHFNDVCLLELTWLSKSAMIRRVTTTDGREGVENSVCSVLEWYTFIQWIGSTRALCLPFRAVDVVLLFILQISFVNKDFMCLCLCMWLCVWFLILEIILHVCQLYVCGSIWRMQRRWRCAPMWNSCK